MIHLVLSDMDGTLKLAHESLVPPEVLEVFAQLRAKGIQAGPASGRTPHELLHFFHNDAHCMETGVMANGSIVLYNARLVYARPVSQQLLNAVRDICAQAGFPPAVICCNLDNPVEQLKAGNLTPEEPAWQVITKDPEVAITILKDTGYFTVEGKADYEAPAAGAFSTGLITKPEYMDEVRERIQEALPEVSLVSPLPGFYDVLNAGCSKAAGMERLLEASGFSQDEVLFFGDSENDLTLFTYLPHGVAVANASDEARAAAHWSCDAVSDLGVVKILAELAEHPQEWPQSLRPLNQ